MNSKTRFLRLSMILVVFAVTLFTSQAVKADSVVYNLTPNNFGQVGSLGTVTVSLITAGANIGNLQVTVNMAAGYIIHGAGVGFNLNAGFTGVSVTDINPAALFTPDLNAHNFDGYGSFAYSVDSLQSTAQARGTNTNAVSFIVNASQNFTTAAQLNALALQVAPLVDNGQTGFVTTSPAVDINPLGEVPEPSSMVLLGSGLLGVGGYLRRKYKSRS